ncbi:M28 family peptidase [Colwellia sp. E2M01]|uniref:M28 family peptidase n=1 Tax=Colwellia sp. E2M01 TaxID=2841561 RepID=UPI001C08E576|nr:M28 family peptidase [Colwellia sp. E2M01]MBU2872235.1 M28 family peptidase [Colwellia sp. E2M01]
MTNQKLKPVTFATQLTCLSLASLLLTSCSHLNSYVENSQASASATLDNTITLTQVTNDVAYLSSDALKGRDNFSPEIHLAADYIAKRFNDIGLTPATNAPNFKQQYTVQQIKPQNLKVTINGQAIDTDLVTMATTLADVNWDTNSLLSKSNQKNASVNIKLIGENDNMRKALTNLNTQGGQHLVLLHPKHKNSFKRYQSYFARGLTTLKSEAKEKQGGVIVIALTDISKIKQLSVQGKAKVTDTLLNNIVGILPGKSKPNEVVLYSAHYDHLGVKKSTNNNKPTNANDIQATTAIFNGADDDASGVSAIINLANYFAKMDNNERTLMFTAFSAEEIGGFGSRYFSHHIDENSITAMINIEMIGKPSMFGEGSVWMTGMERSNLGEQLNQALASNHLKIYADPYPTENLFYRSDNATLARLGVPAHSFSSTQLDKDQHYHKVTDDINSLNLPSMLTVIKTLALATTPLVEGTMTPLRIDANKVTRKGMIYY